MKVMAQPVHAMDGSELQLALNRLNVLGSVLYIAAHPDDENTAALAWFANERLVRTAYLAVTRGDGGQNLVGPEKAELMGLIRTQELLAARRIDGAEQLFTRAIDFGYSKSTDEAIAIWGHDEVLADLVWAIRRFRPDVVITRFSPSFGGHGHHTASAVLAREAFEAAGDRSRFPEQLDSVEPWQPTRILLDARRGGDVTVDLGAYNPLIGLSYTEIAAKSRSQHKSQGFGSTSRRGSAPNSFSHTAGSPASTDMFDGVDLTWGRVPGGERVGRLLADAASSFRAEEPAGVLPILLEAHGALAALPQSHWVGLKRTELLEVIRACAGLWLEANAENWSAAPEEQVSIRLGAIDRSGADFTLEEVHLPWMSTPVRPDAGESALRQNTGVQISAAVQIPGDEPYTHPYWLGEQSGRGLYRVTDQRLIGRPENPPAAEVRFVIGAGGQKLEYRIPVLYRWTDPVDGEQYRPFVIAPPVVLALEEKVLLFPDDRERTIRVTARAMRPGVRGQVRLDLSHGWSVTPAAVPFEFVGEGDEVTALFQIRPRAEAADIGRLTAVARIGGADVSNEMVTIAYPHIPVQVLFPRASCRLVRLDLQRKGERIGYVMGSGDEIPGNLTQVGYQVTLLADDDLSGADLSVFDAIITGVRAWNTRPRLAVQQDRLIDYVREGGTLIVQYNTNRSLVTNDIAPYPMSISRERVTVEEAPVSFPDPDHPLLTTPNRITAADFEGWVQERGLYFAGQWDERFQPVLASNDPGEPPRLGGLLYARVGEGVFIYTGYSWFRQLPAGVPGAYRLFVNMISAGK
jgi:LmbE family N-acetylglucosaminyl deacetylase